MIAAGKLRHRVRLMQRLDALDDYGAPTTTFQEIGQSWASVEALSGRELLLAQQTNAETTHRVVMRYREGVTTATRLEHNGRTLEIESALDPDGRKVVLDMTCHETKP